MKEVKNLSNNKTLRKTYFITQWVIMVDVGVKKLISRNYTYKNDFKYTVLINKAKRFNEKHVAKKYIEQNDIIGEILPVKYSLELEG